MANHLSVAKVHSIQTLHARGYSNRRIAALLGVHRETVARHVGLGAPPGASSSPGQEAAPTGSDSKPASDGRLAPTGSLAGESASNAGEACPGRAGPDQATSDDPPPVTGSDCEPYRDSILLGLVRGLSAVRIHQDLAADHGDGVPSYYSVRRFVRHLGRASSGGSLPYRRMECEPGAEVQVDFGTGAPVIGQPGTLPGAEGRARRRRTHVLRMVLSHSRRGYSEAVYRQTTDAFIRCLENAFWHFGGVPQTLVLDNLKAAVSKADWFDPEINPKVQSFCEHYGIVPLPTKPRMPRHKGKVERGVGYVQDNGLKDRRFTSLEAENRHLLHWETTVADTRIHGTTKQQVRWLFEQVEKPALQPLPAGRFPYFHEARRAVHRDGHVEVAKAYYSVPPEYLGRRLWVRWDTHLVRIFDARMQLIVTHPRQEAGRFSTQNQHLHPHKINSIEHGSAWLLQRAERIGTQAVRWSEAMLQLRGIEGVRVLQGLIALSHRHPTGHIDRACEIALSHEAFRLRTIRTLIQRDTDRSTKQDTLPIPGGFVEEHPIIRSLDEYGALVHRVITTPETTPA
jgi:transposase